MAKIWDYILIRDGSAASEEALQLLKTAQIRFQDIFTDASDQAAPELIAPQRSYSGLEDISDFIARDREER